MCNEVARSLIANGLKVAAVGTQADAPSGVTDLRNIPLGELVNVISAARLFVGPASGPILLAALCKTPYLTWCREEYKTCVHTTDADRLERLWNPLKTPCRVMTQFGFVPPATEVLRGIESMLKLCPR